MRVPPPQLYDPWLPLGMLAIGLLGLTLVVTETAVLPGMVLCLAVGAHGTYSLYRRLRKDTGD
jgi:uncharacterized membrane protein